MRTFASLDLLPREAMGKLPRIVLTGNSELLIEQHKGLYSYDTALIRVRSARGLITVSGLHMTILYFGPDDLLISGTISGVTLESDQPC